MSMAEETFSNSGATLKVGIIEQLLEGTRLPTDATAGRLSFAPARYVILSLLIAGFLVNAAIVLVVLPHTGGIIPGTSGALDYSVGVGDLYDLLAKNLDQGHGYRVDPDMSETMLREPGYPLLLAGVFKIDGFSNQGARLTCVLLAFAGALALLRLARKITGSEVIAMIAVLIFLVYPGTLVAEARAGNDIPCVVTMLVFMLALYRAVETRSLWGYGLAGLLLGVAGLVRSEVLLFPAFLLVYLLIASAGWEARAKVILRIVTLGIGVLVAMAPWIVRNYLLVHQFVPTSTLGGVAAQEGLYTCEHLSQYGSFAMAQRGAGHERAELAAQLGLRFEGAYYYQFFYSAQDELTFNRALLDRVSKTYRNDPGVLAGCAADNLFFKFWFLGKTPQATRTNMLTQIPLLACALGGLIVLYKLRLMQNAAIMLLYVVYIPLVHAAIIAHARHSMLIVAFLAIPAAVFLVWLWHCSRILIPTALRRKEAV